jgi:hypothetical protein
MKKIFLIFALILLFAAPGFSQLVKPVKIDSLVTVSLPLSYQKKDTLGQQIYAGNSMFGYMQVIRAANAKNTTPLKRENDLNKVMKDYVRDIQNQSNNASALNARDTTIGTLKAKLFTLHTDDGQGNVLNKNFTLLYTTDATYTFEYVYPDNRQDEIAGELKTFISSIKLSPQLQRNDQYLSNAKGMSSILRIILFGIGGLVIVFIILFIAKRRKMAY